ncbi:ArsR/SmtB family transcription factor [Helcococcus ovis]|uniref:ArsR/SmtB family transcription factor n=1 Tax=Helcococcus ovis TaxID=72026 RepID=UPI0038B8BFC9
MNSIYLTEPLYKLDALLVATEIFNNKEYYPIDFEKYRITKSEFETKFKNIAKYINNVTKEVKKILSKNSQFNEFFNKYEDGKNSISEYAFISYLNNKKSFSEFKQDDILKSIADFIYISNYASNLEFKNKKVVFSDLYSVIESIENSSFNDMQKFLLVKLSMNVNNILDNFIKMLSDLENIISKNFYLIEKNFENSFKSVKNEKYKNTSLWTDLRNHNVEQMDGNLVFYSSIFISYDYNVSLFVQIEDYKKVEFIVLIGILQSLLFEYKIDEERNEKIKDIIRMLNDYTRLEIINLLSIREMYGKEIADNLNLTTATVSYHINNLIQNKLVNTRTEGRKMYFSLNKKTLLEISDYFKKLGG